MLIRQLTRPIDLEEATDSVCYLITKVPLDCRRHLLLCSGFRLRRSASGSLVLERRTGPFWRRTWVWAGEGDSIPWATHLPEILANQQRPLARLVAWGMGVLETYGDMVLILAALVLALLAWAMLIVTVLVG